MGHCNMTEPTLNYVFCRDTGNGHRMAYWGWGDPRADHAVVCVHGLSRQGRDFDCLAQAMCDSVPGVRVLCPDVVGRGRSGWLQDPSGYHPATYAADVLAMLTQEGVRTFDWVGTSMGGLVGLGLVAQSGQPAWPGPRACRLVLNDVGPVIEHAALVRIGAYLGRTGAFDSVQQAADALWEVSRSFGPHTPEQWLALTAPMLRPLGDLAGRLTLHYDPAIALPLRALSADAVRQGEQQLWQLYDQIAVPTLLLRGAQSDLLSVATARAMTLRGPYARLHEFADVGHAPTLVGREQIDVVLRFLREP